MEKIAATDLRVCNRERNLVKVSLKPLTDVLRLLAIMHARFQNGLGALFWHSYNSGVDLVDGCCDRKSRAFGSHGNADEAHHVDGL